MENTESKEKINWDEEIRRISKSKGISMRELGRRMQVTQGYLSQVMDKRKKPSSLFKAKLWAETGGEFTQEILLELLDDDTKEFVIKNIIEKKTIDILKKSWDEKNWPEIIKSLAKKRNWTQEQLFEDLNVNEEQAKKIMEQNEEPDSITQWRIWDRVHYEKGYQTIINALPNTKSKYIQMFNNKNMERLAKNNQKKLDKKNGDQ